jgi:AraC-like DNA-binding protein
MQIFDFCGEELEDAAGDFLLSRIARTRPGFRGRVAFQELGGAVTLCRSHWTGPLRLFRTERMVARASTDNLMLFCVQMAGESSHHQHDRFAELAAGAGVLKETRSAYERMSSAETWSLALRFPRELLPINTIELTASCARRLDPAAPGMQMLSGYLDQLFEIAEELTEPQRLDAGRAAIDLLAMVLRDVTPSGPSGNGPEEVLLETMRMHVREHLADPELRVEELARRHHVSVRHAYTLFERIGTTPGAYLREQRLLAARVLLSDPRYARFGISRIAAAVGILHLRTFERAFRRQYGMKPSSWRRAHLNTGSAPCP